MHIRGPKRGVWFNHSSDEGGDLFDLVAIVFCNLPNSKADFPKVLEEVARLPHRHGKSAAANAAPAR